MIPTEAKALAEHKVGETYLGQCGSWSLSEQLAVARALLDALAEIDACNRQFDAIAQVLNAAGIKYSRVSSRRLVCFVDDLRVRIEAAEADNAILKASLDLALSERDMNARDASDWCARAASSETSKARLREALRELLVQIAKGNLVDDHGHNFNMNRAFHEAMDAYGPLEGGPGDEADQAVRFSPAEVSTPPAAAEAGKAAAPDVRLCDTEGE